MMKKLISGLVLLAMLACLVLPAAAAEPTALPMTVAEAVDGVSAYCTAAMQAAGTYSDWSILQLARSGNLTDAMRQDYLASLAEKLRACGGVLDKSYYTQYSRTILALTACGENARDFAGYDLTAPLANYDQTVWQGVNGAAFALIAMDSVSYGFAASGTSSRARLVAYLLAQELRAAVGTIPARRPTPTRPPWCCKPSRPTALAGKRLCGHRPRPERAQRHAEGRRQL